MSTVTQLSANAERRRSAETSLLVAVSQRGGAARLSRLYELGHSRHIVTKAIEHGSLARVRRGWVSMPGADAEIVAAARWGVVLTCVTVARRLGLWVLHEDHCHVATAPNSTGPKPDRATVHWASPVQPRHPDDLVDSLPNVLALVATCQPRESALAIWESALRLGMVDRDELARLSLPPAARALLAIAQPFRDSGLESIFLDRLRWLNIRILVQVWIADHHVDVLLGARLVVQLDGGHHVGLQRTSDIAHDAVLTMLGYHVLRFGYRQIIDDWPFVQAMIMQAIAQGLHIAR